MRVDRGEEWVDLLLTDSLDRPLASAPYLLEVGDRVERARLGPDGRVRLRWPGGPLREGAFVPAMRLFICHRTLLLGRGPTEGLAWDRNRLTNVGFDAGAADAPVEPARVEAVLAAFERAAREEALVDAPPREALDAWYAGLVGVSAVLPGAANRVAAGGLIRRWRARRAARRSPPVRSGSHLGELEEAGLRAVAIAVGVGPLGSPASQNRVTVHDWFSGYGTPPREGNVIEPLIDGEEAWAAVARDLEGASREACISSWLADPDIELVRPEALAITNPDRRARYRLAALVEGLARRGGRASILIWNWFGTPILHPTLRRWAVNEGDGIEVLQHAHPQLLGSFHEKTIVVDRRVAYCGGFNLRQNDWDTQAHRVDDPRRNPHALSGWERRAPEPAFPPRHDLALRIEGPLVADVHQNFTRHWNGTLRRERRALRRALGQIAGALSGSGPATPLDAMPEADEQAGPVLVQFVRTDPRLPKRHQAIVDVTLRAISNARRLIYIENQFFRSKRVAEVIRRAMRRRPRLEVVVVTNQVGGLVTLNPQAYWTHLAQETLRSERPEFTLYELLACGELDGAVAYRAVFLHSKVMVVDDEWATVGSANINDRSIYSEYEANVAIEDGAFAKRLRTRLMAEHLGLPEDDARLADVDGVAELFRQRAAENAEARRHNRLAEGRAHPFYQERSVSWVRGRAEWF